MMWTKTDVNNRFDVARVSNSFRLNVNYGPLNQRHGRSANGKRRHDVKQGRVLLRLA